MEVHAKAGKQGAGSLSKKGRRKMDEKKVREAIKAMENQITIIQKIPEYLGLKEKTDKQIEERQTAMEAMKRQLPEKPILEGDGCDQEGNIILDEWLCPNCGARYEVDYDEHDYCPGCGQRIDWSGLFGRDQDFN